VTKSSFTKVEDARRSERFCQSLPTNYANTLANVLEAEYSSYLSHELSNLLGNTRKNPGWQTGKRYIRTCFTTFTKGMKGSYLIFSKRN